MLTYAPPRLPAARPLVVVPARLRPGGGAVRRRCRLAGAGPAIPGGAADAPAEQRQQSRRLLQLVQRRRCPSRQRGQSIRQMVRTAAQRFRSDLRQIFIAGFSAGGGMAAALLAAYPAVFAAGGIVAGMPVGASHSSVQALLHMHQAQRFRTRAGLAADLRAAAPPGAGRRWPRVSIWQGQRDRTVDPRNAAALAAQWSEIHGFGAEPTLAEEFTGGVRRVAWTRRGRTAVEMWTRPIRATASRSARASHAAAGSAHGSSMPASVLPSTWPSSGSWAPHRALPAPVGTASGPSVEPEPIRGLGHLERPVRRCRRTPCTPWSRGARIDPARADHHLAGSVEAGGQPCRCRSRTRNSARQAGTDRRGPAGDRARRGGDREPGRAARLRVRRR